MTGNKNNVNSKARLIVKDIRDDLNELFEKEKFDAVFHLAAQANVRKSIENPKEDAEINIIGSLNLIDNCVKYSVKKFIFSSTGGAIYSRNAEIPCNEDSEKEPESPYGLAKLTIENYLRIISKISELNCCILRYANVYGPRQDAKGEAGVIAIFIDNAFSEKPLRIFGDGNQTRDFIYVEDVVNANLIVLEKDLKGTFNVGTGEQTSVNEISKCISSLLEKDFTIVYEDEIKGELKHNCLDAGKLRREGWESKIELNEGLKETIEWFENYRNA